MIATTPVNLKVCLVEDDPDHIIVIRRAIQELGEESSVRAVQGGQEVLDWLHTSDALPDLILLDINMPGLSGFEVLEQIKADDRVQMIPVVMLAVSEQPADVERAYRLGVSGYISKPSYMQGLRAVLGDTLRYWSAMKRAMSGGADAAGNQATEWPQSGNHRGRIGSHSGKVGSMAAADSTRLKICLIDDDPDHIIMIRRAIRELDEENAVNAIQDGQEALDWLRASETPPDLILLDIRMPGLSGFEVLERIKADDRMQMIPVVMLTSSEQPSDVERAYRLGASGYISKPSYMHDLRAVLGNTLLYWSAMKRAVIEGGENRE